MKPCFRATALLLALLAAPVWAHEGEDHSQDAKNPVAAASAATAPQRLADGSLFVPKAMQRQLGLRTALAEVGEHAASVEFNGRVVADPNASGRVQAIQPGRVEPGPQGLPVLGQKVAKGQVLAWLRPAASSIERGNQVALAAELDAQVVIAESKAARYEQLEGSLPRARIEAARFELEALQKRRAAVRGSVDVLEPLRAPVAGVISVAGVVAGQVVEAKEVLFEVVDPARLAVEALAYDAAEAQGVAAASASVPGGVLELQFVGAGRQLREQAIPLLFRIRSAGLPTPVPVSVGQPLKVVARTRAQRQGAALPQAALMKNAAGESVVWVHTGAEFFAPRKVAVQPLDAARVLATTGLRQGERVVVEGASLLAQMR